MAFTHLLLSSTFLLVSLLVLASASDYGYVPKPDNIYAPKPQDVPKPDNYYSSTPAFTPDEKYSPKSESETEPDATYPETKSGYVQPDEELSPKPEPDNVDKPDVTYPEYAKPDEEHIPKPKLTVPEPENDKPDNGYLPKPDLQKPDYGNVPKPYINQPNLTVPEPNTIKPGSGYDKNLENPLQLGIEGLVLCKSGSGYSPLQGAVARITCSVVDGSGYKAATPFSCLSSATDAKGYFFKPLSFLGLERGLELTDCIVKLEKSPSKTCNIPTDVNKGIRGASFSAYRILSDKRFKLYSVGPFFYTSEPESAPNNGY